MSFVAPNADTAARARARGEVVDDNRHHGHDRADRQTTENMTAASGYTVVSTVDASSRMLFSNSPT